ncbi:MAG TPA: glycosyltransferase family 4 protein [Gammaproteobacteria bacterium]|nr:glycosyltransferase family 4 protein [Gammaproteobacteria bacterium]
MIYLILILLFILSLVITYGYIHLAVRKKWLDVPNQRSSHTRIVPRGGGLVFISLWLLAAVIASFFQLWTVRQFLAVIPSAIIIAVTAFYDDRHSLSAKYRSCAYVAAACISVGALGGFDHLIIAKNLSIPLGWLGSIIAILIIAWSINLFNFMDGIDSIAGVEALFILGVGGFFLQQSGGQSMAFLSWMLAATIAGFLVLNKSPAKVFMGDVGSASLGFIILVIALLADKYYGIPLLLWLILYGVFLFDATITLVRRILAKEVWYHAHRLHAYQRLHQLGWSHGQVVWAVIGVNSFLAVLAILGFYYQNLMIWLAIFALGVLVLLYKIVENLNPMYRKPNYLPPLKKGD